MRCNLEISDCNATPMGRILNRVVWVAMAHVSMIDRVLDRFLGLLGLLEDLVQDDGEAWISTIRQLRPPQNPRTRKCGLKLSPRLLRKRWGGVADENRTWYFLFDRLEFYGERKQNAEGVLAPWHTLDRFPPASTPAEKTFAQTTKVLGDQIQGGVATRMEIAWKKTLQ